MMGGRLGDAGGNARRWDVLVAAAVAQVLVAAVLRAASLPAARAAARRCHPVARFLVRGSDETIAWAIEAVGRRLGRLSTCLVRVVAGELLLDWRSAPVTVTVGVRRVGGGGLEAHAWLVRNDRVLLGGTSDGYVPLFDWTSPPA